MKHNTIKLERNGIEFYFRNMDDLHLYFLDKECVETRLYMYATSVYCNNTNVCLKNRLISEDKATQLLRKWNIKIRTSQDLDEIISLKHFLEDIK